MDAPLGGTLGKGKDRPPAIGGRKKVGVRVHLRLVCNEGGGWVVPGCSFAVKQTKGVDYPLRSSRQVFGRLISVIVFVLPRPWYCLKYTKICSRHADENRTLPLQPWYFN